MLLRLVIIIILKLVVIVFFFIAYSVRLVMLQTHYLIPHVSILTLDMISVGFALSLHLINT